MEGHPAVARAEPLLTAAAATARAERRTTPITALFRVKRGLVGQAKVLLLEVERFVFVTAHASLAGLARVDTSFRSVPSVASIALQDGTARCASSQRTTVATIAFGGSVLQGPRISSR
jgi:hypothetical protein